jgi:hypothetical protein
MSPALPGNTPERHRVVLSGCGVVPHAGISTPGSTTARTTDVRSHGRAGRSAVDGTRPAAGCHGGPRVLCPAAS